MKVYAVLILSLLLLTLINEANAHSLFNSETRRIAGYKIQIATDPEIPSENQPSKIMLAIGGSNDEDLGEVILSLKLMQGENVIGEFGPQLVRNGHLNIDYVFPKPGQYIAEVNIYENDRIIDAKFNIGVTGTVYTIFISLIFIGVFTPVGLLLALKLLKSYKPNK